jgi:hypothetical protein
MNRYGVEMKIRRKIKLIKTLPPREKMRWAGLALMIVYMTLIYLKGIGVWP